MGLCYQLQPVTHTVIHHQPVSRPGSACQSCNGRLLTARQINRPKTVGHTNRRRLHRLGTRRNNLRKFHQKQPYEIGVQIHVVVKINRRGGSVTAYALSLQQRNTKAIATSCNYICHNVNLCKAKPAR